VQETELSITTSDGVVLPATLHAPAERRPGLPGMVLVHGSGPRVREQYRLEAEAFARAGIVTLTYDKRADGYSLLQRSYSRLADDAVAAAATLRQRPEVDPARVGLWGLSEGGWVAPLAASRAPETAFLVTVGANGVSPLRQQTWAEATRLEHAGARGSLVDAASRTLYRLIAGMGLFPEPYYDPGPPLRTLTLPVLGIWGAQDRLTPPVESVAAFRAALDEAGNRHYTLRTLPGGEHRARATTTGFDRSDRFAPGYLELVAAWVGDVAAGRAPARAVAGAGEQPRPTVDVPPLAWYESVWAQWAAPVVLLAGFAGLGAGAAWRRLRGRRGPAAPWSARVLAAAGLAVVLGWPAYLAHLQAAGGRTIDLGPLLAGRPLPWLALQALAVVAVVALAVLGARQVRGDGDRARSAVLLGTGAVFVPWALYWGLLLP
jgi:dienelactone hydrolase